LCVSSCRNISKTPIIEPSSTDSSEVLSTISTDISPKIETSTSEDLLTPDSIENQTNTSTPGSGTMSLTSPPSIIDSNNINLLQQLMTWEVYGVDDITWAPDSTKFVIVISNEPENIYGIELIDAYNFEEVWFKDGFALAAAFSPDMNLIATSYPGGFSLYDVNTGEEIGISINGGGDFIAFLPDSTAIVTGRSHKEPSGIHRSTISIVNIESDEEVLRIQHDGYMRSLRVDPNGSLLATHSGPDERVFVWEIGSGRKVCDFSAWPSFFSPEGDILVAPSIEDWTTEFRDPNTCELLDKLEGQGYPYQFNATGHLLLDQKDGDFNLWDISRNEMIGQMSNFPDVDAQHRVSPDWRFLLSLQLLNFRHEISVITLYGVLP